MLDKVFLDTNILVYAKIQGENGRHLSAVRFLQELKSIPVISTQVLSEFCNVLQKKKIDLNKVRQNVKQLNTACQVAQLSNNSIFHALDLKAQYGYSFFDCLILASALEQNCSVLFSEDFSHGQTIEKSLEIQNPFISSFP